MAEEVIEEQAVEEAPKGGKGKLIITGVVMVLLAVGGWFANPIIMNMINPPPEGEEGEVVEEAPTPKPALFASLHPPLVVNFDDGFGDTHFMQMTLEVMARDQGIIEHVRNHSAVIRNNLILLFSNVTYEAVTTREGKQEMLDAALVEIQDIIKSETGETGVEAVYFTGLIIQ